MLPTTRRTSQLTFPSHPAGHGGKRRAVFLDRDGTINTEVHHLRRPGQLRILPGAADAIWNLNRRGWLVIVVSNQSAVGRGWLEEGALVRIHDLLRKRLKKQGARIDAIYYCAHHPTARIKAYRRRCRCRKPATGMVRKAVRELGVDPARSFMVGDRTQDILCGRRAGLTTVLVRTGYAGLDGSHDVEPHYVADDLREAADIVCGVARPRRKGVKP